MSSAAIRRLRDLGVTDAAEVGGKAAGLGAVLAAGARVPEGVVLTVGVAEMTANERRSLLEAAAGELGGGSFAVRSSGVSEDGAERSFAGIYETVLDVHPATSPRRRTDAWPALAPSVSPSIDPTAAAAWR